MIPRCSSHACGGTWRGETGEQVPLRRGRPARHADCAHRHRGGRRSRRREGRVHDRADQRRRQPQPAGRRRGSGLRGVEPPVRDTDRQGRRGLRHHPRPRRVVGGLGPDLHVHAARGLEVVGRPAAHRRGHRLHDQPCPRRGVAQPLVDGRQPRREGDRRAHRRDHEQGARPEAADNGRLHRSQTRVGEIRRQGDPEVRCARRGRLGPVHARRPEAGPVLAAAGEPQLLGRAARDRRGRVPPVQQWRRHGRGAEAGRDRRRPRRALAGVQGPRVHRGDRDRGRRAGWLHRSRRQRRPAGGPARRRDR